MAYGAARLADLPTDSAGLEMLSASFRSQSQLDDQFKSWLSVGKTNREIGQKINSSDAMLYPCEQYKAHSGYF